MKNKVYRLDELCDIKSGKRIPKEMDFVTFETEHPYIRARDIKAGKINTDDLIYLEDDVFQKIKRYIINSGDIAITIVGASVGDTGYASKNVDGYNLTENAVRLTNYKNNVDSKFLHYVLAQKQYHDYMQLIAGAAAQPKLGIYKVKRIKVELPDLKKQKRIVDILSAYDNLIENNNKRIRLLEQTTENLYKEWFVRFRFPGYEDVEFDGTLPIGWQYQPISESMDFFDSQRVPLSSIQRDGMEKIYPYYGAAKLMDYVDDYLFDGECLLLGEDGTVVTTDGFPILQLVNDKFWVNNHAHVIRGKGNISTRFLYLTFLRFPITGVVTGSAQPKISKGRLEKLKILVPDAITMEYFNNLINPMFDEINILKKQVIRITKQRDMLLPRLMSGKLEV